jgi:hypothetical protein
MYLEECVSENARVCECMQNGVFEYVCEWVYVSLCVIALCVWMCMWEREGANVLVCEVVWMYVGGIVSEKVWDYACVSECVWVWYMSICEYVRRVCAWIVVCLMVHVGMYMCKSVCLWVCVWRCVFESLCNTAHIDHNFEIYISMIFHQVQVLFQSFSEQPYSCLVSCLTASMFSKKLDNNTDIHS